MSGFKTVDPCEYSNTHMKPVRIYGKPYVHKICAHCLSSYIDRCKVPSCRGMV